MSDLDAALDGMRENMEESLRAMWRDYGTTPPVVANLRQPGKLTIVSLLDAGRPEQGLKAAVAERGAQAYVLVFSEAVRTPEGGREWCVFMLWGGQEGQRGGVVMPLVQTPLSGRYIGTLREWDDGARVLWEAVFGPPPVVPDEPAPH